MAARARKKAAEPAATRVAADEKIARLLALLLVKDVKAKDDQVVLLRAAGFDVSETADLLGMTPGHVRVAHSTGRKKRKTTG